MPYPMCTLVYTRSICTLFILATVVSPSDSLSPNLEPPRFSSTPSLQSLLNPLSWNYGNPASQGLAGHRAMFKYALTNSTKASSIAPHDIISKAFLTFDTCRVGKKCKGDRSCVIHNKHDKDCQEGSLCICLPRKLLYCISRKMCEKGEICAQSDFDPRPYCVSRVAEKRYPFFHKIRTPVKMPTNGLSIDRCDGNAPCMGARKCMSVNGVYSFVPCKRSLPCFCIPDPVSCFSSAKCVEGEVCSDLPFFNISICVSREQEQLLESISKVQRPAVSKGFTLDPCTKDLQCIGNRLCRMFNTVRSPCDGSMSCACFPNKAKSCQLTSECTSSEEVCAHTPFTKNPVCVSIDARDAHDGIGQVVNVDPCPVRINRDKPLNTFINDSRPAHWLNHPLPGSKMVSESDENIATSGRVIGGLFSPPNIVRYMAVVRVTSGVLENICSGTLLSPKWVLTAGHCGAKAGDTVSLGARQAFTSYWGGNGRENKHGKEILIKRAISHPKALNIPLGLDFSVLELEEAAPEGSGFMQLNENSEQPSAGDIVRVIGYGLTSSRNLLPETFTGALRQVDVDVIDWSYCRNKYNRILNILKTRHICTGSRRQLCDSCRGDSGGPVMRYEKGVPTLIGVTSFGIGCAVPGVPGVSSAISGGISWLKSTGAIFFTPTGVFGDDVSACAPGEYVFNYLPGVKFCHPCPTGIFSIGGSTKVCK